MFPVIPEWTDTRVGLHQAAQVIGAVRATVAAPERNWTHLGLRVIPDGLTTGALPGLGELVLNFAYLTILYKPVEADPVGFSLVQHTQTSLMDAVVRALVNRGHQHDYKRDKVTGSAVFQIDPRIAGMYAQALYTISEAFTHFRESLPGQKSPAIVWPHGFDLSFLWFATEEASEEKSHMAFGFSPYSAGLERPYFYSYPYPLPDGLTDLELPPKTRWHTTGWTGTIMEYDDLVGKENPGAIIGQTFRAIHETVSPRL
jgi:hypothetical protein